MLPRGEQCGSKLLLRGLLGGGLLSRSLLGSFLSGRFLGSFLCRRLGCILHRMNLPNINLSPRVEDSVLQI